MILFFIFHNKYDSYHHHPQQMWFIPSYSTTTASLTFIFHNYSYPYHYISQLQWFLLSYFITTVTLTLIFHNYSDSYLNIPQLHCFLPSYSTTTLFITFIFHNHTVYYLHIPQLPQVRNPPYTMAHQEHWHTNNMLKKGIIKGDEKITSFDRLNWEKFESSWKRFLLF